MSHFFQSTLISPESGLINQQSVFIRVVFHAPFAPKRPYTDHFGTENPIFVRIWVQEYPFFSQATSMALVVLADFSLESMLN